MRRLLQDADGHPAANANSPDAAEEAELQSRLDATTSAADGAFPRSNRCGGRGQGRGGFVCGKRGAGRGGGRCAAVVARGGRGGRNRGRGRGRGARLGRGGRSSGLVSSDDEEERTVSESDDDSADALPPPRLERTRAASRTTSPPPSTTAPAPATTIEAARAATELISSQPLSTGDANDTGDGTHPQAPAVTRTKTKVERYLSAKTRGV